MKGKVFSLLLCLVLLTGLILPVSAAEGASFLRGGYELSDWDLFLYGTPLPGGGTLTVSTDSQTLESGISTIGQAQAPTTVYCLVDATTSLNEQQKKQQQEILENIGSRLGENDNMLIATFDESVVENGLTGDAGVISTTAKTVGRRVWHKNLYQAVVQALDTLQTGTQFCCNRVLLILSDGNDSGKSDVTEEKAIAAIEKTRIPVYSIALTGNHMTSKISSYAAHLKNLSEASLGGLCLLPAKEKISAANAADKVWQDIQSGALILVNLQNVQNFGRDFTLRVRYETADIRMEDTLTVYAADLPVGIAADTQPLPEETSVPEPMPKEPGVPGWIWVAGGVAAVAVVILVIVLIAKKKRKPVVQELSMGTDGAAEETTGDYGTTTQVDSNTWGWDADKTQAVAPIVGGCRLEFVALMHPEVHFSFELAPHKPVTFGRDSRANQILNGKDAKLSGIHFEAEWDEKRLYLRDKNSTNGTRLNGGLCKPESWIPVENGSVLTAGGYDYRMSILPIVS